MSRCRSPCPSSELCGRSYRTPRCSLLPRDAHQQRGAFVIMPPLGVQLPSEIPFKSRPFSSLRLRRAGPAAAHLVRRACSRGLARRNGSEVLSRVHMVRYLIRPPPHPLCALVGRCSCEANRNRDWTTPSQSWCQRYSHVSCRWCMYNVIRYGWYAYLGQLRPAGPSGLRGRREAMQLEVSPMHVHTGRRTGAPCAQIVIMTKPIWTSTCFCEQRGQKTATAPWSSHLGSWAKATG
jgi:hypothetical protein